MANALYAKGKQNLLSKAFNLGSDDMRVVLTDNDTLAPSVSTHDALDDISAGTVATSTALASQTVTDGVYDAADKTIEAVTGASVESLTIYLHTGTPATSLLLVYLDTGTNIPFTPNTGDVTIQWHVSGILSI
jgi:hypothetical protein